MQAFHIIAAVVVFVLAGQSADDELAKFQGTWSLKSGERDGAKLEGDQVEKSKIAWTGAKAVVESPHQAKAPIVAATRITKVAGEKSPGEMEWVRVNGPHAGEKMLAIYEFLDADNYRICFAPAGKDRPAEFHTKMGTGHILHVWKRAAK